MGAKNALAALAIHPGKLDHAPRQTLVAMALLSLDRSTARQTARCYYGGWQRLAIAQGHLPSPSSKRLIARHLRTLSAAGLIEQIRPPSPFKTAVWELRLGVHDDPEPVDNPP